MGELTSIAAIARSTRNHPGAVLDLVRAHQTDLERFGEVALEIRPDGPCALLTDLQALALFPLMRAEGMRTTVHTRKLPRGCTGQLADPRAIIAAVTGRHLAPPPPLKPLPAIPEGLPEIREFDPAFSGYGASADGRVWSRRTTGHGAMLLPSGHWREIHGHLDREGYRRVSLARVDGVTKSLAVHRLVLRAFAGPCPVVHVANHLNGVKDDNRLANLEWVSYSGNRRHALATGLVVPRRTQAPQERLRPYRPIPALQGEAQPGHKLDIGDVAEIRRLASAGWLATDIAPLFGISRQVVGRIIAGQDWRHVA